MLDYLSHFFVSAGNGNFGGCDSTLGRFLRDLSSLGSLDSNFSSLNEALGMLDSCHSRFMAVDNSLGDMVGELRDGLDSSVVSVFVSERRSCSVRSSNNLKAFGGNFISNLGSVGLDDDSVVVGLVNDNITGGMVMVVHNGGLVSHFIETELVSIFGPVSLSRAGYISSSSVQSGVSAKVVGSSGHVHLVLGQFSLLKDR